MQTDAFSRSAGLLGTLRHTVTDEGFGALFKGYVPIALRQVPYSSTKLVCFELCAAALLGSLARLTSDEEVRSRRVDRVLTCLRDRERIRELKPVWK